MDGVHDACRARIDSLRIFFLFFFLHATFLDERDFSSFFFVKTKKKKDLLGIRSHSRVSSLLNSRSNVWHTSGLIATESEAERWKIQMYLFFIFFVFPFFFPPVVRAIACKAAIRAFNLHALFLLTNG